MTGQNFESKNLLDPSDKTNNVTTGAFVPFGTATKEGQLIKGDKKNCTGCVLSVKTDGSDLRLHAWGLRNPYGMAFYSEGNDLFIANNGADDKGIRPITNDTDNLYTLDLNSKNVTYYGWSDFFGNGEPVTDPKFQQSHTIGKTNPNFLIKNHPPVTKPLVQLGYSIGQTQAAYSTNNNNSSFGPKGTLYIGEFGTIAPVTHIRHGPSGEVGKIIGQKVISVDSRTGNITDFISLKNPDASFRPVGLAFNQDESALYIADFGKVEIRKISPQGADLPISVVWPYPNTGVIWKVTKSAATAPTTAVGASSTNATTTASNITTMSTRTYHSFPSLSQVGSSITTISTSKQQPLLYNVEQQITQTQSSSNQVFGSSNTNNTIISIPQGAAYIKNMKFYMPDNAQIMPGGKVTWINDDYQPHTATAGDGSFDTRKIDPGESVSVTIKKDQGQIPYYCSIHPWMTAIITVSATAATSSSSSISPPSGSNNQS